MRGRKTIKGIGERGDSVREYKRKRAKEGAEGFRLSFYHFPPDAAL